MGGQNLHQQKKKNKKEKTQQSSRQEKAEKRSNSEGGSSPKRRYTSTTASLYLVRVGTSLFLFRKKSLCLRMAGKRSAAVQKRLTKRSAGLNLALVPLTKSANRSFSARNICTPAEGLF